MMAIASSTQLRAQQSSAEDFFRGVTQVSFENFAEFRDHLSSRIAPETMTSNVSRRGHLPPSCLVLVLFLLFSASPGSCVPLLATSVDEGRSLGDGAERRGARIKKSHGLLQDDAALDPLRSANLREEHAAAPRAMASARTPRGAAPEQPLGSQGSAGGDIELPQSCGGCTWIVNKPDSSYDFRYNLTMTGAPDCGLGCPTTLDFSDVSYVISQVINQNGMRVSFIDPTAFKTTGLGHVTRLVFSSALYGGAHSVPSDVPTEVFPAGVFKQLTGLTRLDLDGNLMSSVPAAVAQLTGLRILNLKGNSFTNSSLLAGAFDQLTSLHILDLSDCYSQIHDDLDSLSLGLPAGVFDKLTDLRILDLSGSLIFNLPTGIFDKLTSLTGLYLPTFRNGHLSDGVFDQLTSLRFLSIDAFTLSILPAGVFDKLTGLAGLSLHVSLYARFPGKQSLPAGAFDRLTNLTVMYLDPPTMFMCFVPIPSSVETIMKPVDNMIVNIKTTVDPLSVPNTVFDKELYDALPRCEE